ncbi:response regulator [Acaryochloris sp. IP29b_bin.148]|uniref:response regulator n=1 Tax=Acaryochloris sp. IP29b_bin.148 TaxID=2969218 RepID=UPI002637738A|nr:response regulator [Acaryochloris sp. IP29b_bin.148]
MKILVVEDDQPTADALITLLTQCSYAVETATDGESAADMVEAFEYDLLMLDVILPKLDGITLCRQLRNQGYTMPILLLTGQGNSHDKAVGLDAGADDYVVKPFDLEELEARIRALLRRGRLYTTPILEWADIQLDPSSTQVSYQQQPLALTPKEYALLELLLRNPRRVFSCGMLLEHLWTYADMPGEEAVRTHIKGLRHKLRDAKAPPDVIETVYGIGYRLKPLSELDLTTEEGTPQMDNSAAIATIWQRYHSRISDQVKVLEQTCSALQTQSGQLDPDQQQQAEQEAHTLAGALGMFGLHEGTQLARTLEQLLKMPQPLAPEHIEQFHHQVATLRQTVDQSGYSASADLPEAMPTLPSLLIIDSDDKWVTDLTEQARHWNWTLQTVADLDTAQRVFNQQPPQVILIDPAVDRDAQQILTFLQAVAHHHPAIPVLFYGPPDGLHSRLEVARLGGRAYLEKPLTPMQVLHEVDRALQHTQAITAKIMIVDDDPQMLQMLPPLLEPWGFKVSTLADARLFWQTLVAVSPDLLILDIEMPHVSGMELCQVVRNDAYWHNLPIIFLTAHTEAEIVNQIFALGADDFVSKPVIGPELVVRLVNRLERMQLSQQFWQMDTLTKAYKRQPAVPMLEHQMKRAQELQQPLCLALVKVTNLRQINDDYSLGIGDAILRYVGHELHQGCGDEAVVARWSSNEFFMGLYGVQAAEATHHIQHLGQSCQTYRQPSGEAVPIALTMGVVQYPQAGGTLSELYKRADQQSQPWTCIRRQIDDH